MGGANGSNLEERRIRAMQWAQGGETPAAAEAVVASPGCGGLGFWMISVLSGRLVVVRRERHGKLWFRLGPPSVAAG